MTTHREPGRSRPGLYSRTSRSGRAPWIAPAVAAAALLLCVTATHATDPIRQWVAPRVLIVGGGPDLENNQVAIESNVRYVSKLLPRDAQQITLFADGNVNNATVLYDSPATTPPGERVFSLLFRLNDDGSSHYRKPKLGARLDGASKKPEIDRAFTQLAADNEDPKRPVMLYFTGHGSRNTNDLDNNHYDLWGAKEGLTVRELAKEIARLPDETPINVVMVQCFSGAFGNLIFENGDPTGAPVKRDLAGFFATVKERVAAGCTSAVDEEDYHDFTSYFFAALTGRDRVGRRVAGADYNGDGRVGMDEAFCYTLIHDDSIDVPVCTSDVFLRRYVPLKDADLFRTGYSSVLSWASPAQRAALEALSATLNKRGEDRLATSYDQMVRETTGDPNWNGAFREATRKFESLRREGRRALLGRWPDLRRPGTEDYDRDRKEAIAQLARDAAAGKWKDLLDASDAVDRADRQGEAQEIAASRNLRYVRLGKSVIIAHWLAEHGASELKARYARLIAAEARTPLPPYGEAEPPGLRTDPAGVKALFNPGAVLKPAKSCCSWYQSPIGRVPAAD
jgi:hypothetical protein